jgi:hypothetical protein
MNLKEVLNMLEDIMATVPKRYRCQWCDGYSANLPGHPECKLQFNRMENK